MTVFKCPECSFITSAESIYAAHLKRSGHGAGKASNLPSVSNLNRSNQPLPAPIVTPVIDTFKQDLIHGILEGDPVSEKQPIKQVEPSGTVCVDVFTPTEIEEPVKEQKKFSKRNEKVSEE